jgi:hypothetical protein
MIVVFMGVSRGYGALNNPCTGESVTCCLDFANGSSYALMDSILTLTLCKYCFGQMRSLAWKGRRAGLFHNLLRCCCKSAHDNACTATCGKAYIIDLIQ